jgi:hypothetical protein
MTDNTSTGPKGTQRQEPTGMPLRLIRGDASPEEIAALVAILVAASGEGDPAPSDGPPSQWNSPRQRVRTSLPHGPGGWRASTFPH